MGKFCSIVGVLFSVASADPDGLWPPNHKFVNVTIVGVKEPDGDATTISVNAVHQDELVNMTGKGAGNTEPDATLNPLTVRAERNGNVWTPGDARNRPAPHAEIAGKHVFISADGSCETEISGPLV